MNKMYRQLHMEIDRDLGDKFPQEREGVQGGEFTHVYKTKTHFLLLSKLSLP
jgi:hypothetical protein